MIRVFYYCWLRLCIITSNRKQKGKIVGLTVVFILALLNLSGPIFDPTSPFTSVFILSRDTDTITKYALASSGPGPRLLPPGL